MNRTARLVLVLALTVSAAACGKKKEDGGSATGGGGGDQPAAASIKLAKVGGLSIDVPGGAEVGDMGDNAMLTGPEIGAMTVEIAKTPKTLDEVKAGANDYSPQHLKDEKLADGFAVTWDNSGSMGANFFVEVHRTIGGKPVHCSSTVSKQSQADAVLAACKTIK